MNSPVRIVGTLWVCAHIGTATTTVSMRAIYLEGELASVGLPPRMAPMRAHSPAEPQDDRPLPPMLKDNAALVYRSSGLGAYAVSAFVCVSSCVLRVCCHLPPGHSRQSAAKTRTISTIAPHPRIVSSAHCPHSLSKGSNQCPFNHRFTIG